MHGQSLRGYTFTSHCGCHCLAVQGSLRLYRVKLYYWYHIIHNDLLAMLATPGVMGWYRTRPLLEHDCHAKHPDLYIQ